MIESNTESFGEKKDCLEAVINRKRKSIPIEAIDYVESRGRKIILHLSGVEMTFYSKISDIENKLVRNGFVRVHQSFMVRMADISKMSRTSIKCGNVDIPVSRRYYGELRKMIME